MTKRKIFFLKYQRQNISWLRHEGVKMESNQRTKEVASRKQITFDLIEKEKKDHTLSKESNERDSKTKQNQKTDR